jgi:iron complex outermembrane receptor protein
MIGNKIGDWSFSISADRLDNRSHPTDFTPATAKTGAAAASGQYTVVTGAHYDSDIANKQRVTTASISADHTVKDDGTFKLGYDFSPVNPRYLHLQYLAKHLRQKSRQLSAR